MLKREITFRTPAELYSAELKAAMYSGGNMSKLIQMALKDFVKEMPGYENRDLFFDLEINGRLIPVKVLNVPCKEEQENLILTARLETILAEILKDRLNHQDNDIVIDFDDLI